jgi:D-glycero-beta-D-manno-heptose 1-phosphate adenylyltransferase
MFSIEDVKPHLRRPLILVPGCFDLLHIGHLKLFLWARQLDEWATVLAGVNSDQSVAAIKPGRPIIPERDRALLLMCLQPVDDVCVFDQPTPYELIQELKPNIVVKGHDWVGKFIPEQTLVNSYGGVIRFAPALSDVTTSGIISRIKTF